MEQKIMNRDGSNTLALRVEEMAHILSISRNSAYELVRSGQIRAVKVGRIYRIPKSALDEFLDGPKG